jgi:hypothetical protein
LIVIAGCADGTYPVEVGATAEEDQLADARRSRRGAGAARWGSLLLGRRARRRGRRRLHLVLLLDRRPPLLVSHDTGQTWDERGAGLPPGRAVALRENPDHVLYGGRNRLYVSGDGGRFWRALAVELPEIHDVAWG